MKTIEGLNYREWQKRNTENFSKLNPKQQKEARKKGYKNVGWLHVQKSWNVLKFFLLPSSLIQKRLEKNDVLGAIDYAILEAEQTSRIARESIKNLEKKAQEINQLAQDIITKYRSSSI